MIDYDNTAKLAGIGVTSWTRLGLERWFPNYKIISLNDTDSAGLAHMPPVLFLDEPHIVKQNSQHMIMSDSFSKLVNGPLADYTLMTYKPVTITDPVMRRRVLMTDKRHTLTYENKAWLRQTFAAQLPFAPYQIYDRLNLPTNLIEGGNKFVLQHEQLSGGKGTYFVATQADYDRALSALPTDGQIVVSEALEAPEELSIQCCVTKFGTVHGAFQKQIVREPSLCNVGADVVNGYCGAEIGKVDASMEMQQRAADIAEILGDHMRAAGYKGIFGIDFLRSNGKLYLLEVNARLTGVTPLLNMMYDEAVDIPFYLLHTLELGGYDYQYQLPEEVRSSTGSLLILQSQEAAARPLTATVSSGVYRNVDGELRLLRRDSRLISEDPEDVWLVQQYVGVGAVVKPGARLLAVMTKAAVLNADDHLTEVARVFIGLLRGQLHFQSS